MVDVRGEVGPEIVALGDPPPTRRWSSRSKVSEVPDTFENGTTTARRTTGRLARAISTETDVERPEELKKVRNYGETGKSMLLKVLEELKELKDASNQQREFMQQWQKQQTDREQQLYDVIRDLQQDVADTKEELKQVKDQLEVATRQRRESPFPGGTQASYPDIVRNSANEQQNVARIPGQVTSMPSSSEPLFCTVDTSKVQVEDGVHFRPGDIRAIVEKEIRTQLGTPSWRCRAVTTNSRTPHLARVLCRDEDEHQRTKEVLEANLPRGIRLLRDEYYQIAVDGVRRSVFLDDMGNDLPGVNDVLSKKKNETEVVKVGWLSHRQLKEITSIVVYLKKATNAARFLREGYFHAGGPRGNVREFKRQQGPSQCYNFQELTDHKAYQCKKPQRRGRCAGKGHITALVLKLSQNVCPAEDPANRLARIAGSSNRPAMSKPLRIIELNVRKRGEVHDSMMNDEELQDAAVIAIQEPQARKIKGQLLTTPMAHHKWTKMVPSTCREEGRWAIRSMLWIRKALESEQVPLESSDLTCNGLGR